ncbi:unnamed protein product [Soboliphyme baturini]|uniref:Repressor of RNA polymerase III transcription MAF1 homolog n=1 Tax=Soboliphyme baturini TaxID=241478 RepID=A0A3P8AET7_9BILA|nr:unnamed protein product [Soboliphyme baturini]
MKKICFVTHSFERRIGNEIEASPNPGQDHPVRRKERKEKYTAVGISAAGQLCDSVSHKTLFHLISTLNASFPDYDFTSAKGENFSRVPSVVVRINAINMQLSAAVPSFAHMKPELWSAIDEKIDLKNCCVYNSDPYCEDGCIWSFNYFFYNRKLKRVLFFSCRAFK